MIRPMSKPVVAVGLLGVMAGAWYWALTPVSPPSAPQARPVRPGAAVAAEGLAVHLDRLGGQAIPPDSDGRARDPFRLVLPTSPQVSTTRAGTAALQPSAPGPTEASGEAWPRLALIGLAEAREATGLVRTAIVSGPRGVHHVKPGDLVEQVYRVERIAIDGVDVRLEPEGRTVRLTLRP